jgi:hypothetical protein
MSAERHTHITVTDVERKKTQISGTNVSTAKPEISGTKVLQNLTSRSLYVFFMCVDSASTICRVCRFSQISGTKVLPNLRSVVLMHCKTNVRRQCVHNLQVLQVL